MKKGLLFIFALGLMTGCTASKENVVSDSPKESVALNVDNFSKYVAINTICSLVSSSYSDATYYSYFIGAEYCKFVNCTVSYEYVASGGSSSGNSITVPLTLSGDGQANPYFVRSHGRTTYTLVVRKASGTVEVYR